METYLSKKYSHCHPGRPRRDRTAASVSLSACFSQSIRSGKVQVRSAAGCRRKEAWGSRDKGRNYQFRKPDTVAIKRRQEENCLQVSHPASTPDSYLSDTEGLRSADTITPIHWTRGRGRRKK